MKEILQSELPEEAWLEAAGQGLPGVRPLIGPWLRVDDACNAQLALRDRLIADRTNDVLAALPGSEPALSELRGIVMEEAATLPGYRIENGVLLRPDGVKLNSRLPDLAFLGRACQEDFCLLEKQGDQHCLTAAALCFPASWRLSEKIGRPLAEIHVPVADYDAGIASRVQRLFDGLQVGRPIWRANSLLYQDPALYQPTKQREGRPPRYFRSERQVLLRLPETRAIVFSIHTIVLNLSRLSDRERERLPRGAAVSRESR